MFAARTGRDVDTVLELHGVYLQLAGRDSTGADARNLVLLKGLLDWAPLASALSSNVVTAADVIGCCDRRRDDDTDKGAAHMLLSFAEFLELVLELQTLIDQFSEMMPAQTDARRGPSFGPDEAAMARFEALLSATTAAPPHRRSSLLKAKSEMLGLRGEEMRSEPLDKESSILDLKMKSFAGNLRKQDARHSSKWRFRRVIFSGLILSYFSGHDQKGAFSLKGQNARAALGRSVSAADLETLGGPTSVRDMPLVQSSYGPVYVITPNCDELVRRLDLEPCSFTVYTDAGKYSNFIAETQDDAEHWVEVISHNLELSDKIASRNSAFFGDKHVPKMLSIKEE